MKDGRYKYHSAQVPLYRSRLHVCIGHNLNEVYKATGISSGAAHPEDLDAWGAMCFQADRATEHGVFILVRPNVPPGYVAHEAVHAVNYLLLRKGIQLDRKNDEPQAYLTEWVVALVHHALRSKEVKAKKTIKLK